MEFNLTKIENKGRGSGNRKITDEEIIDAINSGLFESKAAIARYFKITPQAIGQRIKRLREKGLID